MDKKIKVLVLADHPLAPSGVGTQTGNIVFEMLKTGKFSFICLAGAVKHGSYQPQKMQEWGDDLIIYPVDGYGNPDIVRSIVRNHRPDILLFFTDPRFFGWLWQIENEIRSLIPMVYYHVWDNYPLPIYNKNFYRSTDVIVSISKLTNDVVKQVSPETELYHVPHAVNTDIFTPMNESDAKKFRAEQMPHAKDKFIFFWINRNARRKQSGTVIWWYNDLLKKIGRDKTLLLMHTDPQDPNGQDLQKIINDLGLTREQVLISDTRTYNPPLSSQQLASIYNMADCTVNIADAEGFGLGTLESLACGTPIIVNKTGGLQEQITDGKDMFGIAIEPKAKAVIGSLETPYIYEDRILEEDFLNACEKMINMSREERREIGLKGCEYVKKNYSFEFFVSEWERILLEVHEKYGSWDTRKGYKSWEMVKI